ncbi:MAG: hhoA 1 [Gemmataceae bacterium]|nr:hhoA 1 [Gemmataceae bacterium]
MPSSCVFLVAAVVLFTPRSIAVDLPADALSSCAWIRAENDGSGSGFVVDADRKWLVTCRHVVADRDQVDVFFPWHRDGDLVTDKSDYLGNRPFLRDRGLLVTGKVLKRSDAADLALVELGSLPPGVKAIPFAASSARSGDPLRVVGHRLDLDTLWNVTTGPARQTGRLANGYSWRGRKLAVNADAIVGQLPVEEGDSGGPVVNARGELVGMVAALRRQTPTAAVVISAAEVRKFLSLAQPKTTPEPPGIADTLTRATVWVRPTATDFHTAGVLIDRGLILTSARGIGSADRVGVAFPLRADDRWVSEREPYRDPVGLHLRCVWRAGTVLARDPARDLALVRVESVPESARAVPLADKLPAPGDPLHAMSHPGGLEFAWVYAAGTVRQRGRVALADGEKAPRVAVNVLQLPAQSGSPGGPILNNRGELVGVLSARESPQQVGYAATADEIGRFLDAARTDRPARTAEGLLARVEAIPGQLATALAEALAARAATDDSKARLAALRDCNIALALDQACSHARLHLAGRLIALDAPRVDTLDELDTAVESGRFDRDVLVARAGMLIDKKDWRKARGDLDRLLDVFPADAEARQILVRVLLELNKDDEAAAAVADTLRADPKRFPVLAADLLAQADEMAKRFPDAPSHPAGWLRRAVAAAHGATTDSALKDELAAVLKRAAGAKDDTEQLAVLRAALAELRGKR